MPTFAAFLLDAVKKKDVERSLQISVNEKLQGMNGFIDVDFVAYGSATASDNETLEAMVQQLFPAQGQLRTGGTKENGGGKACCQSFAAVTTPFADMRAAYPFLCKDGDGYEEGRLFPSHVLPQVYLSNYGIASDPRAIQCMGITHVVNCTPHHPFACAEGPHATINMRVAVTDIAEDALRMQTFFEPATAFMNDAVQKNPNNKILVHCKHGQSRSATIIVAYMLKHAPARFETADIEEKPASGAVQGAITYLQRHRPRVFPNAAFHEQLELWGSTQCS
jgi:hypothetical protein